MWSRLLTLFSVVLVVAGLTWGWREARQPGRFQLEEIRLLGRVHTDEKAILDALRSIGVVQGANLLRIDPRLVLEKMAALPWIRKVRVERVYPGVLAIAMVEKVAVCMGRQGEQLTLLDEYGKQIKSLEKGDPLRMPVVFRNESILESETVVSLMNLLGRHAWLREQLSEAISIPGDRWIMYTKKGVRILFSQRAEAEMNLLKQLQGRYRILDRRVRQVDMRVSGLVAVRPLPPEKQIQEKSPRSGQG
ncbi:MAG: FtsQ-type POTRA domain-containing protein [Magnetococcales bacterium]|nr:FtsQ-type POTRA domain-containing protein [Magnetococcales bacterium]MBF0322753.1 FtsQ-type POTRA domain-containing protein [Magnetococcales bacterium]